MRVKHAMMATTSLRAVRMVRPTAPYVLLTAKKLLAKLLTVVITKSMKTRVVMMAAFSWATVAQIYAQSKPILRAATMLHPRVQGLFLFGPALRGQIMAAAGLTLTQT